MTILQQEEAKNFFKDAKPDILYGYFERGTMLNNYWEILGKKTIADIGIFKSNLAKQLKVLEEKCEYLKKLQVLQDLINATGSKIDEKKAWALYYEAKHKKEHKTKEFEMSEKT